MSAIRDGDKVRIEANGSGWANGTEGIVAGAWKGRRRVKITKNAPAGVSAVLLEEDAVCARIGETALMPLCSSCQGGGKIEWEDEEGWQHEAPCDTCNGEGEMGLG
ncbi:hypothetical protein ACFQ2B_39190 [Streptomyces stramineus]|uniref:Molecular chaperone DnaJ n=1 Tax=Streptomyces stramineus TaxID=173861 RepID=A0ABN1AMI8_9ACTN